ncbi:MAG: hypothetical protein HW406_958 [Candidatus Brocadiaceae bacterium]|nr:hypothetical protein [Candidatus Brocadiaceae bacterium]
MRQKSRILVIALAIIGASMAWEAILVIAAAQEAVDVKKGTDKVAEFLECVNDKIKAKGTIDISDTVACLPGCCTVTLTMSTESAQAACFSGGPVNCQLPRVILKCPGPPQVEFSYLLCPTGSAGADDVVGSNRVEIGVVVGETGSGTVMVMADIPVPRGTSTVGNLMDVISVGSSITGSKGCNECHGNGGIEASEGVPQLSERIEVFGTSGAPTTVRDPSSIIDTDDCQVEEKIKGTELEDGLKKQTLSEICDCIDKAIMDPGDAGDDKFFDNPEQAQVVLKLCQELRDYQKNRDISGTCTPCITPTPTPSGTPPQPTPKPSPTDSPTVITLSLFSVDVVGDDGTVLIKWETATEIDNAEFNLYRAKTKDGRYKKINDTPIPAQGNAVYGDSYSFVDRPPANGTYYYKLEDVDYYGVSTLHGPVKVRVRSAEGEARRKKK